MKWLIPLILVGLLMAGAVYSAATSATVVEPAPAARADIREFVDEQAVTRLPLTHLITMPFDGRIEPIDKPEGTKVAKGEVVARVVKLDLDLAVDDATANVARLASSIVEKSDKSVEEKVKEQMESYVTSMRITVQAADARQQSGEAKLAFANNDLSRVRSLRESTSASIEQLQAAELRQVEAAVDYRQDQLIYESLKSILAATELAPIVVQLYMNRMDMTAAVLKDEKKQAEVRLAMEKEDRRRGEMTSPIDGVVLERLETNERQVAPGTVLVKIGDLQQLEIEADVLSQDVVRVKVGDPVEIYGPAVGEKGARGRVTKIYPAGFTKTSSLGVEQQRVKVVVGLDGGELPRLVAEQDLGVGYRVRVRIFTAERRQALVVPRSALFRGPTGGWQLFVVRDGKARLVDASVGLMNDERAEITAGLNEGEQVVPAPESSLVDGTRVRGTGD